MKTNFLSIAVLSAAAFTVVSCAVPQTVVYTEAFSPEETTLNLVKITNESNNSVIGTSLFSINSYSVIDGSNGISSKAYWITNNLLDISPDGSKIAYLTRTDKDKYLDNIMVRSVNAGGVATQRTFRNVASFSWGNDNKLYFTDIIKKGTYSSNHYICSVNAEAGSLMNQHTNGDVIDKTPILSEDGKIYFVRVQNGSPAIWSLDKNGTLTCCANGYNPCLIPGNNNGFYCVRNSSGGRSEIWYVDFIKGQESLVLSDANKGFTNPRLSPDGKWILCVGNSVSTISQEQNLDIYVVRTDGTQLTQLTYHPASDCSPVWAKDGRSIYFISSRANENKSYNIWRMNFSIE